MTIEEIKQAIEDKKTEARSFTNAKDLEGAKKAMEELRALQETLKIEEELEQSEIRDLERQKEIRKDDVRMEKVNEFRSIVKSIIGEKKAGALTPEEREAITSTSVGTVIPKEFVNKVEEIKKGYGSLKGYCDVITVLKNEGTIPVCNLDQNDKLGDVTEGDVIADGTFITTEIPFKCKKVGLIQSLSSESLEDAEVEIEGLINKNFAELAVATENKAIVTLLKASATAVDAATDYSDIQMAMDTVVPAVRNGMVCFTNVNGFAYLKNLKDGQKRPLNLVTEIGGKYYFNGKELVVVDMEGSAPEKKFFIIANPKEAIKFIERKGISIAKSSEAGFTTDTVKLRILERLAIAAGDKRSVKSIELA